MNFLAKASAAFVLAASASVATAGVIYEAQGNLYPESVFAQSGIQPKALM